MSVGLVLSDRYRLLEQLAVGGMGEVWRGSDEMLMRPIAIKLLREEHVSDEAARARFRSEARFAAALHHGGIAQVFDYGEHGGTAYLVMELVAGRSLSRELAEEGRLAPDRVMDVVEQAARALQVAHSAGIVHRDIKPANLMITNKGKLKITDFGIARGLQGSDLTQTGMVMGTVHYLSPEQASGKSVTGASDLYSLGVVAYECLAGHPPFDADAPVAVALKHVSEPPPPLPEYIPLEVRELVYGLLEKSPLTRLGGAREVADRAYLISAALRGESGFAEPGFGVAEVITGGPRDRFPSGYDHHGTALNGFDRPADGPATCAENDFGFDDGAAVRSTGGLAADNLPSGVLAAHKERTSGRSLLFVVAMTAGLLILGAIVVGSLLRDSAPAEFANENRGPARSGLDPGLPVPSTKPPSDQLVPKPATTARGPGARRTTRPSRDASPPRKARSTPIPTKPNVPEPTPRPAEPPVIPPSPDPDPSSSPAGGLGSGT